MIQKWSYVASKKDMGWPGFCTYIGGGGCCSILPGLGGRRILAWRIFSQPFAKSTSVFPLCIDYKTILTPFPDGIEREGPAECMHRGE